jgi:hypothetical protein
MAEPRGSWPEHARSDFGGDHARDTHREGLGDDYARERPVTPEDTGSDEEVRPEDAPHIGKASE